MNIEGVVIKGKDRGKKLGFPTANIKYNGKINDGIYVSKTLIGKKIYPSVTFIGKAITFDEKEKFVETYILNFNDDLYNEFIKISLLQKIRENIKFDTIEELKIQMNDDIKKAKKYFNI